MAILCGWKECKYNDTRHNPWASQGTITRLWSGILMRDTWPLLIKCHNYFWLWPSGRISGIRYPVNQYDYLNSEQQFRTVIKASHILNQECWIQKLIISDLSKRRSTSHSTLMCIIWEVVNGYCLLSLIPSPNLPWKVHLVKTKLSLVVLKQQFLTAHVQ